MNTNCSGCRVVRLHTWTFEGGQAEELNIFPLLRRPLLISTDAQGPQTSTEFSRFQIFNQSHHFILDFRNPVASGLPGPQEPVQGKEVGEKLLVNF